ncbi:DUF7666 domain-containing protein [Schaalia turicensis]|uniref:DUF7666 domain-containing protein n=1 Tax=Schaalia turicensis TaxID=131111 RepID=UPI001899C1C6|nr:hypothetical protein [Schaalia turicensis]
MTTVHVCTQEELDEALAKPKCHDIVVCSPKGVWLNIRDSHGKNVEVLGDAMVTVSGDTRVTAFGDATVEVSGDATVRAFENASVNAFDNSTVRAWDRAFVTAFGDATVSAVDHATVKALGYATVNACDDATVTAWDHATVKAWGRASVNAYSSATVKAGICAAVYVYSKTVTRQGGVIIDLTAINANDPETWCAMNLVEVDEDGQAHLYKALDADLNAGRYYRLTHYPIGQVVDDTANWVDNNKCGGGLHASPTPWMAKSYYMEASRFVEVCCPVEELRPINEAKAKAPRLRVLREVTVDGSPIGGETR